MRITIIGCILVALNIKESTEEGKAINILLQSFATHWLASYIIML